MFRKNSFKWSVLAIAIIILIGSIFFINTKGVFKISKNVNEELNTTDSKPGIIEKVDNQLDKDIEFTNGWKSELIEDERFIIVQVGSLKSDSKQRVAVVGKQSKDSDKSVIEKKFLTPSEHGAIKIEDFNAFNLSVVAQDGHKWIFNVFDGFREISQ